MSTESLRTALADMIDLAANFDGMTGGQLLPNGTARIAAAHAALAQRADEPVAHLDRAAIAAAPAAPAAPAKVCHGIPRVGCNYLAECDSVCNKCSNVHDVMHIESAAPAYVPLSDEDIRGAVRDVGLDWQRGWPVGDGPNSYGEFAHAIESLVVARMRGEGK